MAFLFVSLNDIRTAMSGVSYTLEAQQQATVSIPH